MKKIDASLLRKLKACEKKVQVFDREWPDGAEICEENCERAQNLNLDVGWLVYAICPPGAVTAYETTVVCALAPHEAATAPARAAFRAAIRTAAVKALLRARECPR